jgi:hypothetical protein
MEVVGKMRNLKIMEWYTGEAWMKRHEAYVRKVRMQPKRFSELWKTIFEGITTGNIVVNAWLLNFTLWVGRIKKIPSN